MQRNIAQATTILTSIFLVHCGSALQFANGQLLQTYNDPSPTSYDFFGGSVALDGNHVLIGDPNDDTLGKNVGQSHLFDAATGGLLKTFNNPTVTGPSINTFGGSVALDSNRVLIGAPARYDDTNGVDQAHLFDALTGNLLQTFYHPMGTGGGCFGCSIALDGNHVLVGDRGGVGGAHLFDAATGQLLQSYSDPTPTTYDRFGYSVALDGNHVLIGAPDDDTNGRNVGQAHLFDTMSGDLLQTFNDPTVIGTGNPSNYFGGTVAIDGNLVLIGPKFAYNNGKDVHLFEASTGNLLQTFIDPNPKFNPDPYGRDFFGSHVALDGNHVLIGVRKYAPDYSFINQAQLFDAISGNLLQIFDDPSRTSSDDLISFPVTLDGNHVLIGAYENIDRTNGRAHLFEITVPEPATGCMLMGMSLLAVACRLRR